MARDISVYAKNKQEANGQLNVFQYVEMASLLVKNNVMIIMISSMMDVNSAKYQIYTDVQVNHQIVNLVVEILVTNRISEKDVMMETIYQVMGAQMSVKLSLMMVSLV